jgi:hypothetical protein
LIHAFRLSGLATSVKEPAGPDAGREFWQYETIV